MGEGEGLQPETPAGLQPTVLQEAALQMRELFQAYIAAGFSEWQAAVIIGTFMAGTGRGGIERTE